MFVALHSPTQRRPPPSLPCHRQQAAQLCSPAPRSPRPSRRRQCPDLQAGVRLQRQRFNLGQHKLRQTDK
jgi:hypothetical protein